MSVLQTLTFCQFHSDPDAGQVLKARQPQLHLDAVISTASAYLT